MNINLIKISFLAIILIFYNQSIFCKSSEDSQKMIFLTDAQFRELKDTAENILILLLIQQNEEKNVQINLLRNKIDDMEKINSYHASVETILRNIHKLKEEQRKLASYTSEYKEIEKKILEMIAKIK